MLVVEPGNLHTLNAHSHLTALAESSSGLTSWRSSGWGQAKSAWLEEHGTELSADADKIAGGQRNGESPAAFLHRAMDSLCELPASWEAAGHEDCEQVDDAVQDWRDRGIAAQALAARLRQELSDATDEEHAASLQAGADGAQSVVAEVARGGIELIINPVVSVSEVQRILMQQLLGFAHARLAFAGRQMVFATVGNKGSAWSREGGGRPGVRQALELVGEGSAGVAIRVDRLHRNRDLGLHDVSGVHARGGGLHFFGDLEPAAPEQGAVAAAPAPAPAPAAAAAAGSDDIDEHEAFRLLCLHRESVVADLDAQVMAALVKMLVKKGGGSGKSGGLLGLCCHCVCWCVIFGCVS